MITLESVTYRYAGTSTPALRDVSLEIREGEIVGVAGANASGKSTLCLVAAGLAPRVVGGRLSGRVSLDGTDLGRLPGHEVAARVGIGFQSATTQLSGVGATVFEEVAFGPSNLGVPLAELVERTESSLEAVGIAQLAMRDPAQLSGGQQQLVALAALLAMKPSHLVLDEPVAQLDPRGARLVREAIERLASRGIGILIAEHRTDLLLALCARVMVLDRGCVALDGRPRDVLGADLLEDLGVMAPSQMRIERLVRSAGVSLPA